MPSSILKYLPHFDGQTIVSIAIGTMITLITFWLAYKKTVGALEERIRVANQELISSVLKRVAVEREIMKPKQFAEIRHAKTCKTNVDARRLILFEDAKSVVLADVVDNNFLDQASKNAIIDLLEQSAQSNETIPDGLDPKSSVDSNKSKGADLLTIILAAVSTLVGTISAIFVYKNTDEIAEYLNPLIKLVIIPALLVVAFLFVYAGYKFAIEKRKNNK